MDVDIMVCYNFPYVFVSRTNTKVMWRLGVNVEIVQLFKMNSCVDVTEQVSALSHSYSGSTVYCSN